MAITSDCEKMIVPVILSGGSGTRLWPLSTAERPKQFLRLTDPSKSLFQLTLDRCSDRDLFAPPVIVAGLNHRDLVFEQLKTCKVTARSVLLEPEARNTAPAIALAAFQFAADDALMLVMPSDHRIDNIPAFTTAVARAADAALRGSLVTFGVEPTQPETGYGYIAKGDETGGDPGVYHVERFIEKPTKDRAQEMLASGNYLWNSGIFLFSAKRYLEELNQFEPDIARHAGEAMASATTDDGMMTPDCHSFSLCPSRSIDYAIMEKTSSVVTVPLACGWSDMGSWDAIADLAETPSICVESDEQVMIRKSTNSFVYAEGKNVSLYGVDDIIVVAAGDEIVIVPRGQSQWVRDIAAKRSGKHS